MTGFVGVIQLAGDADAALAALQGATNADHDFSAVMDEQALTDIALFIAEETMDYAEVIDADKAAIGGDLATGESLYGESCSDCHGASGMAIDFKGNITKTETISAIANGNPWEFFHKMNFGQPNEADMPPALDAGWSVEEQVSVLAYAQTLENVNPVVQGALLYDKFWNAMGSDEPAVEMPLWATQDTNTRSGKDTMRCKECHGWDYKGVDGAYGGGSHMTGFVGVLQAADYSSEDLIAWLDGTNNADHDYSAFMDAEMMNFMVAFIQEGLVDMDTFVGDEKAAIGDADAGEPLYQLNCAACHGDDGSMIAFGDEDDPEYLGDIANGNPWEFAHKAANGQPKSQMPSGMNLGWTWDDIANVLAYAQTLPLAGE